jgi:hypothetical protein
MGEIEGKEWTGMVGMGENRRNGMEGMKGMARKKRGSEKEWHERNGQEWGK